MGDLHEYDKQNRKTVVIYFIKNSYVSQKYLMLGWQLLELHPTC